MGCCQSKVEDRPYHPNDGAPESAQNITADASNRPASTASHGDSHASRSRVNKTTAVVRPNQPLLPMHPDRRSTLPDPQTFPTSTSSENPSATAWTRAKLEKERNDWWETRTTNSSDIWRAYRQMVEHLQQGERQDAQTLLDATGCTCPTGKLWHSIFDDQGKQYIIHDSRRNDEWLVFEPNSLVEEPAERPDGGLDGQEEAVVTDKGKGKKKAEETFPVKCLLSSTEDVHVVEMSKGEQISSLIKKLSGITGLEPTKFKISYLGQILKPNDVLPTEGPRAWHKNSVLNVFYL